MRPRWRCVLVLIVILAVTACGGDDSAGEPGSGEISVSGVWSRPVLTVEGHAEHSTHEAGANGVVYMTIENRSGQDDRLVGVETESAAAAELHNVQVDSGVMRMRQVRGIDVLAGATVSLDSGGYHVMLVGLDENLEVGDEIEITLIFERAGPMNVVSSVREDAP